MPAPPIESDEAATGQASADLVLLRKLQAGDELAWAELTREYSPRLYSYLRHNLPGAADAEDALSETLLAAVRALPSVRRSSLAVRVPLLSGVSQDGGFLAPAP